MTLEVFSYLINISIFFFGVPLFGVGNGKMYETQAMHPTSLRVVMWNNWVLMYKKILCQSTRLHIYIYTHACVYRFHKGASFWLMEKTKRKKFSHKAHKRYPIICHWNQSYGKSYF
jgi:hypothetical protein